MTDAMGLRSSLPLVSLWIACLASVPATGVAAQPPVPSAGADTRLAEATRALAAGDTARASALATAASRRQHPGDPNALVLIARVHLERGEPDAAFASLQSCARHAPAPC